MGRLLCCIIALCALWDTSEGSELFSAAQILEARSTPLDAQQHRTRVTLARLSSPDLLIRFEHHVALDSTGGERIVGGSAMVANQILVSLMPGKTKTDLTTVLSLHGGRIVETIHRPNLFLIEFQEQTINTAPVAVERFRQEPMVALAEPNYLLSPDAVVPTDPRFNELYGMHNTAQTGGTSDADIDAPEAWDLHVGSRSVVVGVIDTGIDYTHPDLQNNIWLNQEELKTVGGL